MFEDDVLTYPPNIYAWVDRAEELLELLSKRLPMEVKQANRRYGRSSIDLLISSGVVDKRKEPGNPASYLWGTEKTTKTISILSEKIAREKTKEERLRREIELGEKCNQELRESEILQKIYNFMSYLKISGYPVVIASLTDKERNLENITDDWGWTSRIKLGGGILKTPGYFGVCITPQGALMLKNFLKTSKINECK